MKKFIKNNLKVFVTLIISGIVFTGIGVYAASQYFARDITFIPTNENFKKENGEPIENVEDAINQLYENMEDNNEVIIYMQAASISNSYAGQGQIAFDKENIFRKFKVDLMNCSSNVKSFSIMAWSSILNSGVALQYGKIYNIESKEDGYKFLNIYSDIISNTNSEYASCRYKITLYK